MMLPLLARICLRLQQGAYVNEAAISHGVVTPMLAALGWDSADPEQLVPEYRVENGFVDFALLGPARKPAIFIEVKGLGRAVDGDRQLFTYAFHHGVPLCVLTDGRESSFLRGGRKTGFVRNELEAVRGMRLCVALPSAREGHETGRERQRKGIETTKLAVCSIALVKKSRTAVTLI